MGLDISQWLRNRRSLLAVGGVVVATLVYSAFGEMGILSAWKLERNRRALAAENAKLREDIGLLRAEVARLRTNPAYIEEIARRELGLVRWKENVILLERKQDVPPRDPPPAGTKRR